MSTTYAWSPAYEIDQGVIDAQHRQLLDLANLVRKAVHEHRGDEVLKVLVEGFEALEKEALHHFETEEALLERFGSPLLEEHRRLHAQIIREARAIHQDILKGYPADLAGTVEVWMLDRLITHIVRDDRAAFDAVGR
ncbi:MAG TPA: hemerythrin family protein [Azospirillum sp.]|nr:hemerythrin family protein [Azospirillum sp.]